MKHFCSLLSRAQPRLNPLDSAWAASLRIIFSLRLPSVRNQDWILWIQLGPHAPSERLTEMTPAQPRRGKTENNYRAPLTCKSLKSISWETKTPHLLSRSLLGKRSVAQHAPRSFGLFKGGFPSKM